MDRWERFMWTRRGQWLRRRKLAALGALAWVMRGVFGHCPHWFAYESWNHRTINDAPGSFGPRYSHIEHQEIERCLFCGERRMSGWLR